MSTNQDMAFVAIMVDGGRGTVGVAYQGESGYYRLGNMPEFETYPEAQKYAEELNTERLGLSTLEAWQIIASSMRK